MAKKWVLETGTKGTGANVVPLEQAEKPEEAGGEPRTRAARPVKPPERPRPRRASEPTRTSTSLPPGHVRKSSTGEIGKVLSVDPKAGTAVVRWMKSGATSTVPLSAISRR
jgi:hypothetical protein